MSRSISISVPYDYVAVSAAAKMLTKVAEELKNDTEAVETAPDKNEPEEPKKVLTDADAKADLNGEPRPDNPSEEATVKQVFAGNVDHVTEAKANADTVVPAPPVATGAPDVDLDANGFPWDERIHAGSKTKDVKGFWKYKRGVDRDVLVPQVEAELKESMGAIPEPETGAVNVPPAPVEPTGTPEAAPAAPVAETPAPPAPPVATDVIPSTNVTTFAQLVTGITTNSIPEDKVNEAIAAVGLQNFALLGARADLIPTVAGHLGL